jgi:CheY-like chemotaxis protein
VCCVATGAADHAWRLATSQRFEAVLLDVGLPRISDGLRLALHLRSLPDAPILIASTGHMLEPWTAKLFQTALHKPVDMDLIVSTVRSAIGYGIQPRLPFPGVREEDRHARPDRRPSR